MAARDELWANQPNLMAEIGKHRRPVVGSVRGFHADEHRARFVKKRTTHRRVKGFFRWWRYGVGPRHYDQYGERDSSWAVARVASQDLTQVLANLFALKLWAGAITLVGSLEQMKAAKSVAFRYALPPLCNSFDFTEAGPQKIVPLIFHEATFRAALNNLVQSNTMPEHIPINCVRESYGALFAGPTENRKHQHARGWSLQLWVPLDAPPRPQAARSRPAFAKAYGIDAALALLPDKSDEKPG